MHPFEHLLVHAKCNLDHARQVLQGSCQLETQTSSVMILELWDFAQGAHQSPTETRGPWQVGVEISTSVTSSNGRHPQKAWQPKRIAATTKPWRISRNIPLPTCKWDTLF